MESAGTKGTNLGTSRVYRIVVCGEIYAAAFKGMETRDGHTVLTGEVKDQPHLHGILNRINSLGLELTSVEAIPAVLTRLVVAWSLRRGEYP